MIGRLFKIPKHRVYNYKPQFFDPNEEAAKRELRKRQLFEGLTDEEAEDELLKIKMKAQFARKRDDYTTLSNNAERRRSNFTVLILVVILSALAWYIFF